MGSNLNEVYPGSCLTPTSHECLTRPWDTHNLEEILGFEPTCCRPTDLLHNYSLPTNCTTFQRQTLPDATLLTSQTTPVTSQTMPFTSQTMPVTSQTMPVTSQTMPLTSQTMHFTSQTMPFMSQTMPVTSQTIIVASQTVPLTSQTTPMTSQTVPLTSQTMSMTSQAMPVMSQTPVTSQTKLLTSQKVPLTTPTSSMTSQKVPFTSVTTPFTSQVPHMLTLSTPHVSQAVPPRVTTVAPSITSQLVPHVMTVATSITSQLVPHVMTVATSITSQLVPPHVTRLPRLRTSQSVLDTLPQRTTASASSTPSKSAPTPSVALPSTTSSTSDVATCSNTSTNSVTSPSITTQGTSNAATCSKVNALTPTSTRLTLTPPPKEQLQPVKYSTPRASLSTSLVKLSTLPKHLPMLSKLPKKHILPSSTLNPTTLDRTVLSRLSRLLVFWLITSISTVACFPTPTGSNNNNASGPENLSTSSMTIKLSFLDQILNKSTTADTKNADVTSEGDKRQYLSTVLPLNVANLFEGPSTYSSAYDVSHTDTSQLMSTDNETILLDIQPTSAPSNQSVNLAVIPVLGVFFLMVIVWTKCSTWFRDNLRDQDIDDDGKEYVILSPPEEGYREVEFRSDTSSMYYDTVSSYRSILRQKVEYGGFNNYDTVTSIRSILQRPDVCDASVQVRLQGEQLKTERWKSISGILNNSGSSSDLLRVPKKTHRQVSFQTSHNECYDPPLQQMCDANIQVGDSSTERMKIEEKNKEQGRRGSQKSGDITLTGDAFGSKSFGSGTQLSTESSGTSLVELDDLDLAYTSSSQQDDDDDDDDDDELSKDQDTYGTGRGDSASGRSCGGGSGGVGSSGGGGGGERDEEESVAETSCYSGVTSVTSKEEPAQCEIIRPKHKKGHQFQVLRVDSSDGLYTKPQPPPSHEHETTASETTDLSEKDTTLLTETSQDDLSLAQTLSHPHHYLCRRLRKAYSSKDSASISDSISDFKPPIFREVKFGQPPSDEEESDYIDDLNLPVCRNKRQHSGAGEKLLTEKDDELACWCEQFKGDDLNQLLDAHASAVAGAPKASPISMHSSASSNIVSIHSSCSSLAAIKDEAATEGTADEGGEEQDFPPDDSGYIAEEEAPLITSRRPSHPVRVYPETFPKPSRKMGIRLTGSGVGVGGGGGVGSGGGGGGGGVGGGGGGGQDVVVNTVKELREAEVGGDATSCDVTPLTSSNNSLHDSWDVKHTHQQQQQQHQQHQHHHHQQQQHHHQQQQQHPPPPPLNQPHQSSRQWRHQSMESVRSPSEEVPHRDERQSPLYIPHEERARPGYSNNNNNNDDDDDDDDDSLRRSVIDRKLRGNPPPSTAPSNNNNNNNNSSNSNSNSSDNNNSTVGSNSSGGGGGNNNNNNNNNSEEETKDVAFTGAVATTTLPVDQEEEEGTRESQEPVEFKRFHRRPVVPFQYENEPLLSSAGNQTNPTVTSTAEHQQHPTK